MSSGHQTVVVGLDGMPPWLIDMLAEEREIPNICELRRRGGMRLMRSTINMMTASAWPSMFTGVNPGKHGMFNFVQYDPDRQNIDLTNALHRRAGAIWEHLAVHGKRSALLRVPMTFPATPMQGVTVGDHFAPSPRHPEFTWPRDLRAELVRRFGLLGWASQARTATIGSARALMGFVREMHGGVARSFDLIDWALDREEFDLVFTVVSETDTALHALMPAIRPETTAASRAPEFIRDNREALVGIFREVDARVGALMERLGSDANILIVSDHGMSARDPGTRLLRSILIEMGHQGWQEPPPPPTAGPGVAPLLRRLKSAIARRIPWQIRRLIDPISQRRREAGARKEIMSVIDWSRTTAFTVVAGAGVGEIWLNLESRSPGGTVAPEKRTELIEELRSRLLTVRNVRTGEPQIERILTREDAVSGPHSDVAPDLLVMFRGDQDCVAVEFETPQRRTAAVDRESTGAWDIEHLGHHQPDGVLLAAGPDIAQNSEILPCRVEDVTPTLACLLGTPVPRGLDGRVPPGLVNPALLVDGRPRTGPPLSAPPWISEDGEYSAEDQARVEDRLRDLGYI